MIEIAKCEDINGIYQKDIAKNQEISNRYLDQIMAALKVASLIRKSSPRKGYVLMRDPKEITVFDINSAFEPSICVIECMQNGIHCEREKNCPTKGFWGDLNRIIIRHYKSVSLYDLVQEHVHLEDVK